MLSGLVYNVCRCFDSYTKPDLARAYAQSVAVTIGREMTTRKMIEEGREKRKEKKKKGKKRSGEIKRSSSI